MVNFTLRRVLYLFIFLVVLVFNNSTLEAQAVNQCAGIPQCWQPVLRHRLVTNVNISSQINGYAEIVPEGYNDNPNQKFPIIINIPGRGTIGAGTSNATLCIVACEGINVILEQNRFSELVYQNGIPYRFIVLTPQYISDGAANGNDVDAMINYAIANYKVDLNRIYLTGLSSGANMILNYMAISPAKAARIAALAVVSPCSVPVNYPSAAPNMGTQRNRYWGLHGQSDFQCQPTNTINWSNSINNNSPNGNPMAIYNLVNGANPDPHVIWLDVYDSTYKPSGKNISQWMIQYSRTNAGSLPATLGKYEIVARNKEVLAEWVTTLESNTDYFLVERASADMQFKPIGRVNAAGNSSNPLSYSFADAQPLKGNSFYRLSLVNKDGIQEYYEIKKINNRAFGINVSISPVPATKAIQLSFELEEAQKLNFTIRDISGKSILSWAANFSSGYTKLPLNIDLLAPGIYNLSIQGSSFKESKKFIKQ